jgi:putative transcriptional regulator
MVLQAMKNRLRVLRAEQNWSQAELGMRVGVTRQAINAIETGRYDPGLPLAMKIARAFEKKVDDIFELEDKD